MHLHILFPSLASFRILKSSDYSPREIFDRYNMLVICVSSAQFTKVRYVLIWLEVVTETAGASAPSGLPIKVREM